MIRASEKADAEYCCRIAGRFEVNTIGRDFCLIAYPTMKLPGTKHENRLTTLYQEILD